MAHSSITPATSYQPSAATSTTSGPGSNRRVAEAAELTRSGHHRNLTEFTITQQFPNRPPPLKEERGKTASSDVEEDEKSPLEIDTESHQGQAEGRPSHKLTSFNLSEAEYHNESPDTSMGATVLSMVGYQKPLKNEERKRLVESWRAKNEESISSTVGDEGIENGRRISFPQSEASSDHKLELEGNEGGISGGQYVDFDDPTIGVAL
ncbi:hypothetical protein IAT38_006912 [Cryptococcus sp. DSM 104549]